MTADILRRVRFTPYLKGMGPTFALTMWDTGRQRNGRSSIGYRLSMTEPAHQTITLFTGEDYSPSPLVCIDSDAAVAGLMGYLTLRPGDTVAEYFAAYTPQQLDYCQKYAETLSGEVESRFPE